MAAKISSGESLLADGGNLYLRIRPTSKDWLFIYRFGSDGKRRKMGLGNYPDTSLADVRVRAAECRNLISGGVDPKEHRKLQVAKVAASQALPDTVEALFEHWMKTDLCRRRADGGAEVRRQFSKDVLPEIGGFPLTALRRAHITQLLDKISKRGVTRTVGIILSDLRQMFTFALIREIISSDPTVGLKKADWGGLARERDRVLSDSEIRRLFEVMPSANLIDTSSHAIWIMLSTLARVGEITKAKWTDVNFDTEEWTIRKENSKNGVEHVICLSPFAMRHFQELRRKAEFDAVKYGRGISDFVLPATRHKGHVCKKSLAKQIGDRQRGSRKPMSCKTLLTDSLVLSGGKWTPHDLRRTGATVMGNLGVRPDVIEKCLNHVEQDRLKRIYQRQALRPEMRQAWEELGKHLALLVAGSSDVANLCDPLSP